MPTFRELVEAGDRLVVTGEAATFDSGGMDAFRERIADMAPWVDAMNATDNAAAHPHASSLAVAIALRQLGLDPIMQVVCRDRNRIGIQADIVGGALHGVLNVSCLTGDDVTAGDEPEARRVFDLDGPQLIRVAHTLARGRYMSGRKLEPAPDLFIGAVENPGTHPLDYRAQRAAKKILAGARYLQLQICYHPDRLERFVAALHDQGLTRRCAILPTIVAVRGAGPLRFMSEHVPGIDVPAETIARVRDAADPKEEAYALLLEQARHVLSLPGVRGIHLTDFRHDGTIGRLCRDLGIPTREERHAHAHDAPVPVA